MFTAEEFKTRTNWKMSYAEYVACCCERCSRESCPHRDAFRTHCIYILSLVNSHLTC